MEDDDVYRGRSSNQAMKGVDSTKVHEGGESKKISHAIGPIPGRVKSGKLGQLPSSPVSPPMRTQCECDGVGPSRTKSWYQDGGHVWGSGGAVIVQVFPAQVTVGKKVRAPKLFPWVLDTAPRSDTRIVEKSPEGRLTWIWYFSP